MALLGFFLLFLQGDLAAVCLAGLLLLWIPLVFSPTAALVKENLILCFLFFFTLSNLSLLRYLDGFQLDMLPDSRYNLQQSISNDLFLSVAGILVCRYWERVPKDRDPHTVLLRRFQGWYRDGLIAVGAVLLACLLIGSRMEALPERPGLGALKGFQLWLSQSVQSGTGVWEKLLEEYGVPGILLWLGLFVLLAGRILKRKKAAEPMGKIWLMLAALVLAQSFFYQLQAVSTPACVILLSMALAEKEDEGGQKKNEPK